MQVIETAAGMRSARAALKGRVSLVPTMGALHAGHMSLVRLARSQSDSVVASLFVNPTQFGPNEDFAQYPRPRERDLQMFRDAGVDVVYAPLASEVYPPGDSTTVDPGEMGTMLEGAHRPGHFAGVATVVTKLFVLIKPDVAVFGEKDAQQVRVIKRLTSDLMLGVEIAVAPTVREEDGLALSSRNVLLKPEDRAAAPAIYQSLRAAMDAWQKGERRGPAICHAVRTVLSGVPQAEVEYVSAADPETLAEVGLTSGPVLVSLAVRFGSVRLIDNVTLTT